MTISYSGNPLKTSISKLGNPLKILFQNWKSIENFIQKLEIHWNSNILNRKFIKIQISKNRNPLKIDYSKHKILWNPLFSKIYPVSLINWIFFKNLSLQIGNPFKYLFLLLEIDWKKCTQFPAKIGNTFKFCVPF